MERFGLRDFWVRRGRGRCGRDDRSDNRSKQATPRRHRGANRRRPQSRLAAHCKPPGADVLTAWGLVSASDPQKSFTAAATPLSSLFGVFASITALADLQQISIGQ